MKKSILLLLTSILIINPVEQYASETILHSFSSGDTISTEMMNEMLNATSLDLGETQIGIWSTLCLDSKVANNDLDSQGN